MFKTLIVGAGAALALLMSAAATPAMAQNYDDGVARDQCAPRNQVIENGTYVGCRASAPAASATPDPQEEARSRPLPPNLVGPGTDGLGRPNFIDPQDAIAAYDEEAVYQLMDSNYAQCEVYVRAESNRQALDVRLAELNARAAAESDRQRYWTLGRLALGLGQVGLATAEGGPLYGLMVALGQAQTTGDRMEYARLMQLWTDFMVYYGDEMRQHSDVQQNYIDVFGNWCNQGYMPWYNRHVLGIEPDSIDGLY